jgi:small subunit ribosomal protein S6
MFLIDSAEAASDWDGVNKAIEKILDKAKAKVVSIKKWDERRLAYEINKKSRGTYILCYFEADSQNIHQIERDVQLSEKLLRVLILNAEAMSQEDINRETPAMLAEKQSLKSKSSEPQSESIQETKEDDSSKQPEIEDSTEAEEETKTEVDKAAGFEDSEQTSESEEEIKTEADEADDLEDSEEISDEDETEPKASEQKEEKV